MKKDALLFLTGGILYPLIELLWRGYSHYSMALAGGVSLLLINRLCCGRLKKQRMFVQCAAGSALITGIEFIVGMVFNKLLLLQVWDYSALPLNILGQICLPFSLVWFFLTIPAIYLCRKITTEWDKRLCKITDTPLTGEEI